MGTAKIYNLDWSQLSKSQFRSKCHTVNEVKLPCKKMVKLDCMYQQGHTQIKTNKDAVWVWFFSFFQEPSLNCNQNSQSNLSFKHTHSPRCISEGLLSFSKLRELAQKCKRPCWYPNAIAKASEKQHLFSIYIHENSKQNGRRSQYSFLKIQVQCIYTFGVCFVFKRTQLRYPQLHINLS